MTQEEINENFRNPEESNQDYEEVTEILHRIKEECGTVIVGQEELLDMMMISILCDGHILLEGVPGIAKTLSARVLSKCMDAGFSRIQFTPDLMPSDILGTTIYNMKDHLFTFVKGPVFSNFILIDEINRAPAKTQSALFEVMEERQVTFDNKEYPMEFPFIIIATQNPVEHEGTYRLPEAQLDRFLMRIQLDYPSDREEITMLERFKSTMSKPDISHIRKICGKEDLRMMQKSVSGVYVDKKILHYIVEIARETRLNPQIFLGASPRASLALMRTAKAMAFISGRNFVIPEDVQNVCYHVLNHRIILSPETEMKGIQTKQVLEEIIRKTELPR